MDMYFNNPYLIKAAGSIALLFIAWLIIRLGQRRAASHRHEASDTPFVIKYVTWCTLIIVLAYIWLDGLAPMLTALTIVAAALTIVCKELILNLAGSLIIFWRELFAVGDRVQLGDHSGDVIAKGAFYFTLLEAGANNTTEHSTGRLIKVPNALVLTLPVANATRGSGFVWHEINVTVDNTSEWKECEKALHDAADAYLKSDPMDLKQVKRSFERHKIYYRELNPRVYASLEPGKVILKLRYISRSRMTRDSEDFIIRHYLNNKSL